MQSILVSGIVVILSIVLFMFLCIKGLGSISSALICVAVVSVVAIGGFAENFIGTFISGLTANFATFFLLFSLGCAFGGLLAACGASDRMGLTFTKLLGQDNAMYVVFIISILLGLTGVAPLALVPFLAYGLLKACNLPRYIGMVAVASGTTISYTLVPGSLAAPNVLAATILGGASEGATSIYAAPLYSILLLVFTIILNCLYIRYLIKKARSAGIGYEAGETAAMQVATRPESEMPSFLSSIVALAIPIVFTMITILGFNWDTVLSAITGLTLGMLFLIIVNRKYFKKNSIFESIRTNVDGIQWNIVSALAVCGFASVIANTSFYEMVLGKLMGANMNPYVLTVIGALIIGGLCADFIGGSAVFSGTLGGSIIAKGAVNVAIMHRLSLAAASVFDSVPHGGMVLLALNMFGYNHKGAYKYLVISNIVVPLCTTVFGLILAVTIFG